MRRKLYKFNHSVSMGGFVYAHKTKSSIVENKFGLRNALEAVAKKLQLIDATVKVYDSIFFVFFTMKPSLTRFTVIENIHEIIPQFGNWDDEYLINGIYDLQESYLKEWINKAGYSYDEG